MNKAVLFAFLLLFSHTVFSQAAVLIEPVDGEGSRQLYPLEVAEYNLVVANVSRETLSDVEVVLNVPDELALVVDGRDVRQRFFTFRELLPGAREERVFTLKAFEPSTLPLRVRADYGTTSMDNSSSVSVSVAGSGVEFSARLNRTALSPGDTGTVFFDISNNTREKITGIRAELISEDNITVLSGPFETAFLDPGQSISNTSFGFSLDRSTGRKTLVVRVFFTDSSGEHVLEKSLSVDVQLRDFYVAALVFAILVLVVVSLYLRRRKPPKEVDAKGLKVGSIEGNKIVAETKESLEK